MPKQAYTYILTNKRHTVLYIGVTSNLKKRVHEHKTKLHSTSFTSKYNVDKLVYYEVFESIEKAICREKFLKGRARVKKMELIESINPSWSELG